MPTLDDLQAVFADLESRAPSTVTVATRRSRRPGVLLAVAAAVITGGVAVAVPLTVGSHDRPARPHPHTSAASPAFPSALPAPAAGQSPRLRFGFTVGAVDGFRFDTPTINRDYQSLMLEGTVRLNCPSCHGTADPAQGQVRVYYLGRFDAAHLDRSHPVDVNGRPGFYTRIRLDAGDPTRYDVLAWQYAPRAWAVVSIWNHLADSSQSLPQRQADDLRIATAVHSADLAMPVPFRLRATPGAHVDELSADGAQLSLGGHDWILGWSVGALPPRGTPTVVAEGREPLPGVAVPTRRRVEVDPCVVEIVLLDDLLDRIVAPARVAAQHALQVADAHVVRGDRQVRAAELLLREREIARGARDRLRRIEALVGRSPCALELAQLFLRSRRRNPLRE